MRHLTLCFLVLPSVACALGVEDTEFYGLLEMDKVLKISFVDDPQPWSRQRPVYGSQSTAPFSFCWSEAVGEIRQSFVCAASRGAKPVLVYGVLGSPGKVPKYNASTPAGQEYRSIAGKQKLGDGTKRGDGTLEAIYECKVGCSASVPRYIFEVAKYD